MGKFKDIINAVKELLGGFFKKRQIPNQKKSIEGKADDLLNFDNSDSSEEEEETVMVLKPIGRNRGLPGDVVIPPDPNRFRPPCATDTLKVLEGDKITFHLLPASAYFDPEFPDEPPPCRVEMSDEKRKELIRNKTRFRTPPADV